MSIFKRGKVYWFHFLFNGEHVQRSTKQGNPRTARQMEAAHRTTLAKGEVGIVERKAVPELKAFATRFAGFIEVNNGNKPETVRFYLGKLDRLLAFQPLASEGLDRIDAAAIDAYIQHRIKHVSVVTVNRELATLRRLFHVAVEWKIILAVPKIRMLKGERERTYVLSYHHERDYLDLAPQPLWDAAVLLVDTGLRVGEAVNLQWPDVHLQPVGQAAFGYLRVRDGKSKNAKRTVPLTARVRGMLEARQKREPSTIWVFAGEGGESHLLVTSLDHMHAKIARPVVKGKRVNRFSSEFVLHSLRHTMLTRLGEAGADAFTIMRIAGHSSVTVSQRYVHPTPEAVERAFQRLENLNAHAGRLPQAEREFRQPPATVFATDVSDEIVSC
jgi:integrase